MNRRPKTITQLKRQLETIEVFPFGKHKNELVADVVKVDPNYIVWWSKSIEDFPLDMRVVWDGIRNYVVSPKRKTWSGWGYDDGGEWGDYEDLFDSAEGILGDPWDPQGPF
jgi:hypothetical protein